MGSVSPQNMPSSAADSFIPVLQIVRNAGRKACVVFIFRESNSGREDTSMARKSTKENKL